MTKVCIVSHSYPRFQGDWRSNFIESLASAYARNGAEVTVLTAYTPEWNRPSIDPAGVKIVTYKYAPLSSWHTIGYGHSMIGDLEMNPVDVLLAPSMVCMGALKLASLLRQERFDLIHAHWAVPNALIGLAGRMLAGSKARIFASFPGSDVAVITRLGWLGRVILRIIERADYLSCDGPDLGEDLEKAGLDPRRMDYVIYGVDEKAIHFSERARADLRRELQIAEDQIVLLMIGRFVAKKGFSTGFEALNYIRQGRQSVKMIVVGDGPLKEEYLRILGKDGTTPYVHFVGAIPTQELHKYYSACDIFLMPSRRLPSHGLNVVVPEAMACARPIVASDVGGNKLVILPGVNGYLHEENNPRQLAEFALQLAADPALRQKMGQESLRLVRERFNWDAIACHYLERLHEFSDRATPVVGTPKSTTTDRAT
jgi:phosphatidyl-myo-inositol dimannoside synthase